MNSKEPDGDPDEVEAQDGEVLPSRIVLSLWLAGIVVVIIAGSFYNTGVQGSLKAATQPIRTVTGLNQHWGVFAPNARNFSQFVDGRVDFADGPSTTYTIPRRHGLGAYADYRWHKYEEKMFVDSGASLWPAYAEYLADRARASGRNPVRVTLIKRWSDTLPPGPGPQRGPTHEATLFVLDLEP